MVRLWANGVTRAQIERDDRVACSLAGQKIYEDAQRPSARAIDTNRRLCSRDRGPSGMWRALYCKGPIWYFYRVLRHSDVKDTAVFCIFTDGAYSDRGHPSVLHVFRSGISPFLFCTSTFFSNKARPLDPPMDNEKPKRRPRHMNGTRVSGKETVSISPPSTYRAHLLMCQCLYRPPANM